MYKVIVFIALININLISCTSSQTKTETNPKLEKQQKLEDEVMAIHDEVMPKMGALQSLKAKVQDIQKEKMTDSITNKAVLQLLSQKTFELEDAKKSMWDWMHAYKKPDTIHIDSNMIYLENEKIRITEVKNKMLNSLSTGQQLLDSLSVLKK